MNNLCFKDSKHFEILCKKKKKKKKKNQKKTHKKQKIPTGFLDCVNFENHLTREKMISEVALPLHPPQAPVSCLALIYVLTLI